MNQEDESEVFQLPRDVYDNANVHYKTVYTLLIQKGKMQLVEGES